MNMTNVDLKKSLKHLYAPSAKQVTRVELPPMSYLMIDGEGNPNTSQLYQDSVQALYQLAYAVRAICKEAGHVFTVMPLEGLWMIKGSGSAPEGYTITAADKDQFLWTLMIMQPNSVTAGMVEQAREKTGKKKLVPQRLHDVRLETFYEGNCVQIMHTGSYDDEGPTVACLHRYIEEQGWTLSGKHHEIYLSDPRKVAPEKMKTIIRQPFTVES